MKLRTSDSRLAAAIAPSMALLLACSVAVAGDLPVDPDSRIVRPSNTGIPGYVNMNLVAFGPDGRLWVGARDFFWQQGGVAALDFDTGIWTTYSSAETPLEQFSNAIDFAADGSAWIACDDSVVHLLADGETMISHNPADAVGPFADISIAPNGHIWVANYGEVDLGGGLFEFDGRQWIKHEEPWMTTWTGFGFAPALNVFARSNGDVWATFLSSPGRVGLYRDGEWTVFESEPRIIDYAETADGTLYGVSAFGAFRLDDDTEQWQQIGPFGASEIAIDPKNDFIYIQDELQSVMRYDGASWSPFASFPGWIGGFTVAPDGDLWIAAEAWLTHYDLHQITPAGQIERIYNRSNTGMLTYFPPGMYLDHDGHMWFTDGEYGASRLEANENWRNFGVYNGQEEVYPAWVFPVGLPWWLTPAADFWTESVDQIFHDSQGNFWMRGPNIIARSAGDDLSQWTIWEPGENGFPFSCDSVGEDAQGNIWLGTSFVAMRLEGSAWVEVPIGIAGQFAAVAYTQGLDGELYAVRVSTVYHVLGETITPLYTLPDGLGVITDLEVDASGRFWMGTPNNGVMVWDGENTTNYTAANSGLVENSVTDIAIRASDGLVGVATGQQDPLPDDGGVSIFDGSDWASYSYAEGFLPFYAVSEVQFDADGHLWVSVLNFGTVQIFLGDEQPGLIADINSDGAVNGQDLLMLLNDWGSADSPADLNADGTVSGADLLILLNNWG